MSVHTIRRYGYQRVVNTFHVDLLTVMGILAGIGALLFLMSALDPTTEPRPSSAPGTRERGATPPALGDPQVLAARAPVVEQSRLSA